MLKLLIPTDFSDTADNAFRFALHFTDRYKAELIVLHVYEPPQVKPMTLPYNVEEAFQDIELNSFENNEDYIPHLQEIAEKEGKSHVLMSHILLKGDVRSMIKETIINENVDLLLMGTQGSGIIKRFFFGSQTIYMMEHSIVPVLTIPPNIDPTEELHRMVLTTTFSDWDYLAMEWLIKLNEKLKLELYTVYIIRDNSPVKFKEIEKWNRYYEPQGITCVVKENPDFLMGLNQFRDEENINVVAMLTHPSTFIREIFNKNLAKEVVHTKTTAVLAIPEVFIRNIYENNQ